MASGKEIITEVRRVIHDEKGPPYRWSDDELIAYLNAGTRQTVTLVPEANTVETIGDTLTSRVARQSLPTGGIKFIKVARNYADDGVTPQGSVRYVEKDSLDTYEPDWEYVSTKVDGDNYFDHFCHDASEKGVYYLYPAPAADNKRFALVYSAAPTKLFESGEAFPMGDEYFNAVVQYVIYRALTKESRDTLPSAFRQELWQNYLVALGLQNQAEERVNPASSAPPEGD